MIGFVEAGKRGVCGIARFSGRDDRPMFWFYVLWLFIAQQVLGGVLGIGMMLAMAVFGGFGAPHPATAPPMVAAGPPVAFMVIVGVIVITSIVLPVVLLSAAVVRRLHDRGLTGLWGLLVLVPLVVGTGMMTTLFVTVPQSHTDGVPPLFGAVLIGNLIYMVALVGLIVLLCLPGTPSANRFGAPPA